jgi:signal-transduction protein with cAMP-binding, CBS, and nucleotidyltransferase domain
VSVGRIATRVVATASPAESVLEVARRMEDANVGCVVVVDQDTEPVGIVTDRDIVLRGVAKKLKLEETAVSSVMTSEVRTVDESTPIEEAIATMSSAGARRLVVTGKESRLIGLLSLDDVLELLVEEADGIGKLIRKEAPTLAVSD